uniref:PH domain-containing protein n=1 Tax=Timema douglasi TaxID=61478 RepID=A0A7R8VFQ6_TIMDO|nr:unnamed protein product [Timema douglasi]
MGSSPMVSLVLTDSSQLTSDSQHLGAYSANFGSLHTLVVSCLLAAATTGHMTRSPSARGSLVHGLYLICSKWLRTVIACNDSLVVSQAFNTFGHSLLSGKSSEIHAIKKGLLWQQRDRIFSRWKERYFILTRDYLHCFKRASGSGPDRISDMGQFIFKVKLADVERVDWINRKTYSTIVLELGREGRVLLRAADGLEDWFELLEECMMASKERRRALRSSHDPSLQQHNGTLQNNNSINSTLDEWLLARHKIAERMTKERRLAKSLNSQGHLPLPPLPALTADPDLRRSGFLTSGFPTLYCIDIFFVVMHSLKQSYIQLDVNLKQGLASCLPAGWAGRERLTHVSVEDEEKSSGNNVKSEANLLAQMGTRCAYWCPLVHGAQDDRSAFPPSPTPTFVAALLTNNSCVQHLSDSVPDLNGEGNSRGSTGESSEDHQEENQWLRRRPPNHEQRLSCKYSPSAQHMLTDIDINDSDTLMDTPPPSVTASIRGRPTSYRLNSDVFFMSPVPSEASERLRYGGGTATPSFCSSRQVLTPVGSFRSTHLFNPSKMAADRYSVMSDAPQLTRYRERAHSEVHKLERHNWKMKAETNRRTSFMVHATQVAAQLDSFRLHYNTRRRRSSSQHQHSTEPELLTSSPGVWLSSPSPTTPPKWKTVTTMLSLSTNKPASGGTRSHQAHLVWFAVDDKVGIQIPVNVTQHGVAHNLNRAAQHTTSTRYQSSRQTDGITKNPFSASGGHETSTFVQK